MHFATKNYRLLCTRLLGQRGRNLSLVVRDRGGGGIGKTERERRRKGEGEREREKERVKRDSVLNREREVYFQIIFQHKECYKVILSSYPLPSVYISRLPSQRGHD